MGKEWEIKFNQKKEELINDLDSLTLAQVIKRRKELYGLVPVNISINIPSLEKLIEDKFKNDVNWNLHENKFRRTFKIDVGTMSPDGAEKYIKNIIKKINNNEIRNEIN